MIRKLLLRCDLSPGDIVMLTAAVRDLHQQYPGAFLTDVETSCPELWENNPYVTSILESDPYLEKIDCSYPLIDRSNRAPYHCLHGFIEFLNDRLGLSIKPSVFKGDIHLSELEKSWHSQVYEIIGQNIPFWIVSAGGKFDITIKWWCSDRYQKVIDHFQGKIQFVQIGERGHHHPKLKGVIDLRGKTNLRELVRLVYHSQGVLCSVTALMHLAAAVETKSRKLTRRPCVVVAGGREPAHWEAYPAHQFIHNNGALKCSTGGGCWKSRVVPLGDGDQRDQPENLCVNVVNKLPRCMDLISVDEVVRRVKLYFEDSAIKYLSPAMNKQIEASSIHNLRNAFDNQPLDLHSARLAYQDAVSFLSEYPSGYSGKGIIICGGGVKYFTNAWICIRMLRHLGCDLPVQFWYLGKKEIDDRMKDLLEPYGVEFVNAYKLRKRFPVRMLSGWILKAYALVYSSFKEVLLLDADNLPVENPRFLFDSGKFLTTGAIFWPDYTTRDRSKTKPIWKSCGMKQPPEPEFESGQILVNKEKCWKALNLALWFNAHADFYYQHLYGDKDTFQLAFRGLGQKYYLIKKPIHPLEGTMCQHDFSGKRLFQHRNMAKWDFFGHNPKIKDFRLEKECFEFLKGLKEGWNGNIRID